MSVHFEPAKHLTAAAMALAAIAALGMALTLPAQPAYAFVVFDPSNYAQNVLTAARSLTQITNQIRSLQNEATMLLNMARNLSRIDFPELAGLVAKMREIDALMARARMIDFHVASLDSQFERLFPTAFDATLHGDQHVAQARARLETAMAAFQQSMRVQAQVVEDVGADAQTLSALADKSQGAEGLLQATQATNQLLALGAKQQFQIQTLMAAQGRADAIEQARRVQAQADAQAATQKFLGSGSAYPAP